MRNQPDHVVDFYRRHPISREQVLAGARARRGTVEDLKPEDLFDFDQDHYGGLEAVDALARAAGIGPGTRVADFCAGLGGPARYLASRHGAIVVCVELNPDRAPGAADLTRRVGLADRVMVVRADVTRAPLAAESMDAVISQEALLHVPDKRAALYEAWRLLRSGGSIAFTDWALHRPLDARDTEAMWQGIAAQTLQTFDSYRGLLGEAGFRNIQAEDLTGMWGSILEQRYIMYTRLREETRRQNLPSGDDRFYRSYERLVELVQARVIGGARFRAIK